MAVKRYYTREGFVYVPELKMNGRNWKEYRKQVLEVARIQNVIGHLAGVEQKPKVAGKELNEWLQQNSSAQFILMWNIPDSLFSHIQHFEMAHEMFDYLATTFRDYIPIPLPTTKPVEASSGDVAADEPPSTNDLQEQKDGSAFEAHASGDDVQDEPRESCAKPNESSMELPRMERLEDGLTEARSNDEAEAAVGMAQQVTSRGTEVKDHIPEVPSEPCMAQNELQEQPSSRAGKPLESEHPDVLNGMVKVPYEVKNVDRAVKLAGEAAGRARGVDMSHEMASDPPTKLCDGSTLNDLPGARRLPLEGEQAMCTSGSVKDMPTAPAGCKDGPHKQPRPADVKRDNHRCGTSMDTIVDKADTPSMPNDTETISIKLEEVSDESRGVSDKIATEGSLGTEATDIAASMEITTKSDVPAARRLPLKGELAGCASDNSENSEATITLLQGEQNVNGRSSEAAIAPLQGEQNANGPNALTATLSMSNKGETIAAAPQTCDSDNSAYGGAQRCLDETYSLAIHTNMSRNETDALSIAHDVKTAGNARQNIRTRQTKLDSPRGLENESPDHTTPWKRVGIGDADISIPQNVLLETSSTPNQIVTFGGLASADKGSATSGVEGETAGGDGKRSNGEDGTTSSGSVDSARVKTALLAAESQRACRGQSSCSDLPVSPSPPANCRERSCTLIRPKHCRGRIKSKARNVSTTRMVENAMRLTSCHREGIGTCLDPTFERWKQGEHRRHAKNRYNVNPNMLRRPRGPGGQGEVHKALGHVETDGRWCQMGDTTSNACCDSKRVETRLLAGDQAGQHKQQRQKPSNIPGPPASHQKCSDEVSQPERRPRTIKFESANVSRARKLENAHQGRVNTIRPIPHHREGIGTCQDLTIKFRNLSVDFPKPSDHERHVRDRAAAPQALPSTKRRHADHAHHVTYQIGQSRSNSKLSCRKYKLHTWNPEFKFI